MDSTHEALTAAQRAVDQLAHGHDYADALRLLIPLSHQQRHDLLKRIADRTGASLTNAVRLDFADLLKAQTKAAQEKSASQKIEAAFAPPDSAQAIASKDFLAVCVHAVHAKYGQPRRFEDIQALSDDNILAATTDLAERATSNGCAREFERDLKAVRLVLGTQLLFGEAAELVGMHIDVSLIGSLYSYRKGAGPFHICSSLLIDSQGGKADGKGWCLRVKVRNPANEFTDVVIAREDIATGHAIKLLAAAGLQTGGSDRDNLMQLLSRVAPRRLLPVAEVLSGWINIERADQFVWGNKVITRDGFTADIIVEGGTPLPSSGTLDEWKDNVAALAVGNDCYASEMLSAAMAPAKRFCDVPSGGTNNYAKSRNGKSTGSYMGLSFDQPPTAKLNYDASGAGLERLMLRCNDRFVMLEGTERADPQRVQDYAYLAGDGTTRVIARGEEDVRQPQPFNVEVSSSGEESNKTLFETARLGYKPGAEARMPNIPHKKSCAHFDFADGARLAENIHKQCGRYYGTAGPAVVRMLMNPTVREMIQQRMNVLRHSMTPEGTDGEEHEVIKRLALKAAVGEACIDAGILPWPSNYPEEVVRDDYARWLDGRGGHGDISSLAGIEHARAFLFKHKSRFEDRAFAPTKDTINRIGYHKSARHNGTWFGEYIVPACQNTALIEIFGTSEYKRALAELETRTIEALEVKNWGDPTYDRPTLLLLTPKTLKLFAGKNPLKSDKGLRVKRFGEASYVLLKTLDEDEAQVAADIAPAATQGEAEERTH